MQTDAHRCCCCSHDRVPLLEQLLWATATSLRLALAGQRVVARVRCFACHASQSTHSNADAAFDSPLRLREQALDEGMQQSEAEKK